jgi:hypothetical protein
MSQTLFWQKDLNFASSKLLFKHNLLPIKTVASGFSHAITTFLTITGQRGEDAAIVNFAWLLFILLELNC